MMYCKFNLLILTCFIAFATNAQVPNGYYNSANGLTGAQLQQALHNIIDNHTVVSYNNLYSAFTTTDTKPNGQIWDIYSDIPNGTPPYTFTNIAGDRCGSYNGEGDCFNREHSWPQSWFNSEAPAVSDLFHVYPTDGYVNNKRDNYPYGEVANPTWTSQNGSKLGGNTTLVYAGTAFEPLDEYKGDLARTYFYMATRYKGEDATWSTSPMTDKATIKPWAVCLLLDWHNQDPVSTKELNRNNAIYQLQNNRNPFIDNPAYADSIFVCTLNSVGIDVTNQKNISIFPNPATNQLIIEGIDEPCLVKVFNNMGKEVMQETIYSGHQFLAIEQLIAGFYWVNMGKTQQFFVKQ